MAVTSYILVLFYAVVASSQPQHASVLVFECDGLEGTLAATLLLHALPQVQLINNLYFSPRGTATACDLSDTPIWCFCPDVTWTKSGLKLPKGMLVNRPCQVILLCFKTDQRAIKHFMPIVIYFLTFLFAIINNHILCCCCFNLENILFLWYFYDFYDKKKQNTESNQGSACQMNGIRAACRIWRLHQN